MARREPQLAHWGPPLTGWELRVEILAAGRQGQMEWKPSVVVRGRPVGLESQRV